MKSEENNIEANNPNYYDCVIVGAGISGIAFAAKLKEKGQKVLVVEKSDRLGGQIQSFESKIAEEFWFEMGAHTCYNSYTSLISLVEDKSLLSELQKGSYITYANHKLRSIASQINYFSMLTHFFRYFTSKRTDKTVKEYFTPIVGKNNYEKLFSKAFRAVICQPADSYPADLFLKRRNGRNEDFPRKFSFKKGISSFLNFIIENLNIEIKYNTPIAGIIQMENDSYELKAENGNSIFARSIAMATDAMTTAYILKPIESGIARLLETIETSKSTSIGVVIHKETCAIKPIAGIIPTSNDFMSVVSRDLIAHESLRAFVFHYMGDDISFEDKQDDICKVLGINRNDILEHTMMEHRLPSLRKEHIDMDKQIESVRNNDNIYIIGNYFYGLSLEDCVNRAIDEYNRYNQ